VQQVGNPDSFLYLVRSDPLGSNCDHRHIRAFLLESGGALGFWASGIEETESDFRITQEKYHPSISGYLSLSLDRIDSHPEASFSGQYPLHFPCGPSDHDHSLGIVTILVSIDPFDRVTHFNWGESM
jgi:hypothetical protein